MDRRDSAGPDSWRPALSSFRHNFFHRARLVLSRLWPNRFLPPPSKINESVEIVTIDLMIACHELYYCRSSPVDPVVEEH